MNRPSSPEAPVPARQSPRRWAFRVIAALGVPLLACLVFELGLRLVGSGHPTAFLLQEARAGAPVFVPNRQFGWRFFGRTHARAPYPDSFPCQKPPGTYRVFVFGESAAYGDPHPDFGLPRMLHALLSERYPHARFEVINAAMTAINSHVILPLARDCARAGGDFWVVYMGNNEVIGPYGVGTVYGGRSLPLGWIRATLALKATRTGQMLDTLLARASGPPPGPTEWGGLQMFLNQQLAHDDPRLERTYRHFERNLRDLLDTGLQAGATVVVSTVPVNLKHCAPFAAGPPAGLGPDAASPWMEDFARVLRLQEAGQYALALEGYRQLEARAPDAAELQFRLGQCALALEDTTAADRAFRRAMDLDRLRFRCDHRLNAITRRVAAGGSDHRAILVDAEQELARQSPAGVPGSEFFYEHVHLTFEGTYRLARILAEPLAARLPEAVRTAPTARGDWPSLQQCARRLGWSAWAELSALGEIAGRLADPPFPQQADHALQWARLQQRVEMLRRPGANVLRREAEAILAHALERAPDDPALLQRMATLWESTGRLAEADQLARRLTGLLPHTPEGWNLRGVILARAERFEEAAGMFRQSLVWDPGNVFTRNHLAQSLARLDRPAEAILEYQRALAWKPTYGTAHLGLGRLLEAQGKTNAAAQHYSKARQHPVHRAADLTVLARFCVARGWPGEAATHYALAIRMNPTDSGLRLEAGRCAHALGRHVEAGAYYAEAVALAPDSGEARFLLGRELGRAGDNAGAAEQFAQAVRLMPSVNEARLNLGIALLHLGKDRAALDEFEEVLRRDPSNSLAQHHAAALRGGDAR